MTRNWQDKVSTPVWVILCLWVVSSGFIALYGVGSRGAWRARANGFQATNAQLARKLSLAEEQLTLKQAELATVRTRLAETQSQLVTATITLQERRVEADKAIVGSRNGHSIVRH